jgi:Delta6-protoilludene synthase
MIYDSRNDSNGTAHSSKAPIPRPANNSQSNSLIIPDTLCSWPWPRHLNSHYAICKKESEAWCEAFHAFSSSAQKAFNFCDFSKSLVKRWRSKAAAPDQFIERFARIASLPFAGQRLALNAIVVADLYPHTVLDGCRVGCDLMNLFFVIDEHTDVADAKTARNQADIVMDALRNPHTPRPTGEWVGGEMARQSVSTYSVCRCPRSYVIIQGFG